MTISRIFFPVLPSRNPVTVLVFLANCRVKFLLPRVYCASPLTSMGICNPPVILWGARGVSSPGIS